MIRDVCGRASEPAPRWVPAKPNAASKTTLIPPMGAAPYR